MLTTSIVQQEDLEKLQQSNGRGSRIVGFEKGHFYRLAIGKKQVAHPYWNYRYELTQENGIRRMVFYSKTEKF